MPVEMSGPSGTCGLSLVEADIVTLRLKHSVENRGHFPDRLEWFEQVGTAQLGKCTAMHARSDEQMAIIIRVAI
jgi:hypothetical protein